MTAKTQFNARISAATRQRLDDLTAVYGTQAEALAVAVDRLHTSTFPQREQPADVFQIGQRVTAAGGWPEGTVEQVHMLGGKVNSIRIRLDSGAVYTARPDEIT